MNLKVTKLKFAVGILAVISLFSLNQPQPALAHTVYSRTSCPAGHEIAGPRDPSGLFPCEDASSGGGSSGVGSAVGGTNVLGNIKITLPSLGQLLSNLLVVAFLIAGIFFLVQIVLGGIMWIGAGGDQKSLDAARSRITNAVIGLVIVVASVSIAVIVTQALGVDIFTKTITIGG